MLIFSLIYFLLFCYLSHKNFRLAVGIFIILLPAYLIRFNIGSLPTTLLEVSFGALFLVWIIKYAREDWPNILREAKKRPWFTFFFCLFFLSSVVSIFVSDMWYKSLGQWRAYFLEPMLLFVMLVGRKIKPRDLIWFLALSTVSVSVVAIVQKLTGQLFPPSLWDDELNGRVTSFFTTPNAVGLYLAPIVMLSLAVIARNGATKQSHTQTASVAFFSWTMGLLRRPANVGLLAMTFISILAIFFSFSQGAWIALGAGFVVMAFFLGYKKIALITVLSGIIIALAIPQIRSAVLFQDRAGQNRLTLWSHSMTFLTSSPKNFFLGTGIRQYFRKVEKPYYNPVELERLIYPHNSFLNFWTEIGLFGLLSAIGIFVYSFYLAFKIKNRDKILGSALIAVLVVIIVHGLVDVPYFKNDLSMLFWIIVATIFSSFFSSKVFSSDQS
ncbi:O-antigen ligase family protein [Patescibacteria group bacterium]|nr:O-antigen ligase family protein [Patescibacteria group bacterium]